MSKKKSISLESVKENGNKLINFYDVPAVKKLANISNNPCFEAVQIDIPSRVALIGRSGAGKTNALINYIYLTQNTFRHIAVCFKEMEPLYEYLQDKLKESITFYRGLDKLPSCSELPKALDSVDGQILLILDDMINEKDQSKINEYMLRGRKQNRGITIFYLAQSYYKIPLFCRQQLGYIIIVKVGSKRDLRSILSDCSLDVDIDKLAHLYKEATKVFPSFFKINLNAPEDKTFSKDFNQFLDPT